MMMRWGCCRSESSLLIWLVLSLSTTAGLSSDDISTNNDSNQRQPFNVIHIIVDDLRPELGCYGVDSAYTPNIDKLASKGVVFDRAYAQQAVCGPSRNSFMSGRRPDRSRSWNFINHFRQDHPEWTSLPGLFLKHDGLALGSGKTYHPKLPPAYDGDKSWSPIGLPYRNPCWNTADNKNASFQDGGLPCVPCLIDLEHYIFHGNVSIANEFCETDAFEDTFTIEDGIVLLRKASDRMTQFFQNPTKKNSSPPPFYLAVGLHKPHMPWQAAAEDFAKHPLNDNISLPLHPLPPQGMPDLAFHFTDDNIPSHTSPWTPVNASNTRAARRAYRAAVTGMDRKLGQLLDAVGQDHNLANTTAIVFHSDHGWQLGEHGEWRKMTNFELAVRVPLIISVPGITHPRRSNVFAELVDIYPTIADLAGLKLPVNETVDGVSLVPTMLLGSGKNTNVTTKTAAFSQYPRAVEDKSKAWKGNGIIHKDRTRFTHMGYSIRVDSWRYTEWHIWNQTTLRPVTNAMPAARELYYHGIESSNTSLYPTSFDRYENVNVAGNATNANLVDTLSKLLRQQFNITGTF